MKKLLSIGFLLMLCALGVEQASASHFRYGNYSWKEAGGNTIEAILQNSFRRSGYGCLDPATLSVIACSPGDGLPQVGDVISEGIGLTQFNWGDGTIVSSPSGGLLYRVSSIDPSNDWLIGVALDPSSLPAIDTTISHTYQAAGDYLGFTDACCRISSVTGLNDHINNPDGNYNVETLINTGGINNSPVTTLPPIVLCPLDAVCSFVVPAADPDSDPLNFRLSASTEAGNINFSQPGPPDAPNAASVDPSTGIYIWDTTGATLAGDPSHNTLYSTQVTIEDPTSKVAVDFLIQLVDEDINPPVVTPPTGSDPVCNTTQFVTIGSTLTFDVEASDPDVSDVVTLNVAGLPNGATMTPSLPVYGNPVSSSFAWMPSAANTGTHIINFNATSSVGGFTLCPVTIEVNDVLIVAIDIRPDHNDPNSISLKSKGVIPVTVLTTDSFDATKVDEATVLFGATGNEATPSNAVLGDIDGDGDDDMTFFFMTQDTGIACGDTSAYLTGETYDGQAIEGVDSVNVVGCN